MSNFVGPNTTKSVLALNLDASNKKSYPGTGTIWTDLSRAKFPFFPSGATNPVFNPANNGYFMFDGTGYYGNNQSILGANGALVSASIWFQCNGTGNRQYVFNFLNSWGVYLDSGTNVWITRNGTTQFNNIFYSIPSGKWSNIVMSQNAANNISIFVDGNFVVTSGVLTSASAQTFEIGKNLVGNISHFTFYKGRVLTAKEIYNNYISDRGRFGV
jgi:hypothetical protein